MLKDEMTNGEFWEQNIQQAQGDLNPTLRDYAFSRKNQVKHVGYEYRGNVFLRTISALIPSEAKRAALLEDMETLVNYLIDSVKAIKRHSNFAMSKRWRDFN